MAEAEAGLEKKKWYENLIEAVKQYGWIGLVVLIATYLFWFSNHVHQITLQQSYELVEANEKIGILEGKIEFLEEMCVPTRPTPVRAPNLPTE